MIFPKKFFFPIENLDLEPYTVREVRIHVKHINELIHSCDFNDFYTGTNGYSLCLVNDLTNDETPSSATSDRRKTGDTNSNDFIVPEYLLPNQQDILLTPLFTTNTKIQVNRKTRFESIAYRLLFLVVTMLEKLIVQRMEPTEWFSKTTRFVIGGLQKQD